MTTMYHAGERAVQEQAGVSEMAGQVGKSIKNYIPSAAKAFLATQPMALVGSVDGRGQVWASLLTGAPGFAQAVDDHTVMIAATPVRGDPLFENLASNTAVGLLIIEPETRRRMRLNGTATVTANGGMRVHAQQVYSNCPKYIQSRHIRAVDTPDLPAPSIQRTERLSPSQQHWLARTDTFFIASTHKEGGSDISHRGGNPGFVHIVDAATFVFPDYAGNTMFQTLGNIAANPHVGLLFVDWDHGTTLQLTGEALIIWDTERLTHFGDVARVVEVTVKEVIETAGATPLRGEAVDYSPYNPA